MFFGTIELMKNIEAFKLVILKYDYIFLNNDLTYTFIDGFEACTGSDAFWAE